MSENKIYEITQMMQNPSVLEGDFNEAAGVIMNMFQEKYVKRLTDAVREKHVACCDNPPKEVHLLHALKPFMAEENHAQIDNVIDTLLMAKTFAHIQGEISAVSTANLREKGNNDIKAMETPPPATPNPGDSIHEDGIYDVDAKCMLQKQNGSGRLMNILLVMAMQGIF